MHGCGFIQKEDALCIISEKLTVFWNWSSKAERKERGSEHESLLARKLRPATLELPLCTSPILNFMVDNRYELYGMFLCLYCIYDSWELHGGGGGWFICCDDCLLTSSLLHIRSKKKKKKESSCTHLSCLFSEKANFLQQIKLRYSLKKINK